MSAASKPTESSPTTDTSAAPPKPPFRFALGVIAIAPLIAALIGSAYNIWYNVIHIRPLLTDAQHQQFQRSILYYNVIVYPVLLAVWLWLVYSMRPVIRQLAAGQQVDAVRLDNARSRSINLPWHIALVMAIGWAGCIPMFLLWLRSDGQPLHDDLPMHLCISLIIAGLITVTHALFSVELLVQKLLFPVLFHDSTPSKTKRGFNLTLGRRGLIWAISAGVCPIASLLLLGWAEDAGKPIDWFRVSVGGLGVVFGLISAWLLFRLIADPVKALRSAAGNVAEGDLHTRVDMLRADEFGPLIDEFNRMIQEMRAKQKLTETFGLHVGRKAAEQILAGDPGLGGRDITVSILFCDIRNFTARCAACDARQVVRLLNLFLTDMVRIIEQDHGGMVNKFLGDGFMAMFGADADPQAPDAADQIRASACAAVNAGREMNRQLHSINQQLDEDIEPLAIGIGIHTGTVAVGNIGSPQRLEYTAIGQSVNIAARVEALTKAMNVSLLLTDATREHLPDDVPVTELEPQMVKGQPHPINVFAVDVLVGPQSES